MERNFGGTTVYVYAGTVPIAPRLRSGQAPAGAQLNQPNKEYIYSGSQLLATLDATNGTSYQYHDHLSTRVEADASGTITRTFGHFPFGEVWYETGTASKWKFTSYERDSESQLDYADFRYDSSRLGRFMSPDRLAGGAGNPGSLNRYAYVISDPVNLTDASGMGPNCLLDAAANCVGGGAFNGCATVDDFSTPCSLGFGLVRAGALFNVLDIGVGYIVTNDACLLNLPLGCFEWDPRSYTVLLDHFGGGYSPIPSPAPPGGGATTGSVVVSPVRSLDDRRRQYEGCVARARAAKNELLTTGIVEDVFGGGLILGQIYVAGVVFQSGALEELAGEPGLGPVDSLDLGGRLLSFTVPGMLLYGKGVLDTTDALNNFDRAKADCAFEAGYPDIPVVP